MPLIHNPVLRGFNPDPSFLRVGEDYYVAVSTFEWFPGVCIHQSRDLIHWRLIGHALDDAVALDLRGIADSGGVWAPSLSWSDGQFFLVYTNVRTCGAGRPFKDSPFYLITADDILGPWSAPVKLGAAGFDPSLFHDDDGRKYLVNMAWDFRKGHSRFGGITVQEYDYRSRRLVGAATTVLQRDILIEGPNLYQRDGFYYLMVAEGGTSWNHGMAMARSRSIMGPYELDPAGPVLTSRDDDKLELQKAGHGELVETPSGEWYLAHLCSRPIVTGDQRRCMLGRETALQQVAWSEDGWLRLAEGGHHPRVEVAAPRDVVETPWPELAERDHFDDPRLGHEWSSLRTPVAKSWLSLSERPGWLRLRGRDSLFSLFEQSLVAQRLTSFHVVAETCVEFTPENFNQMAGLICWYDTRTHFYLRITHDEKLGVVLGIVLTEDGIYDELIESQLEINNWKQCFLRAEINQHELQFFTSPNGKIWQPIGPVLDATKLSDDYGKNILHFTGAFVGICCQDMSGAQRHADFDYFERHVL
jgi:xylan 1,4-beta-xylosidase